MNALNINKSELEKGINISVDPRKVIREVIDSVKAAMPARGINSLKEDFVHLEWEDEDYRQLRRL